MEVSEALNGLVWDGDGDIWWGAFHANDLPNYTKLTSNPCQQDFAAVAYGADGCLYGADYGSDKSAFGLLNLTPLRPPSSAALTKFSMLTLPMPPTWTVCWPSMVPYVLMIDEETGAYSGYWEVAQ